MIKTYPRVQFDRCPRCNWLTRPEDIVGEHCVRQSCAEVKPTVSSAVLSDPDWIYKAIVNGGVA